MNCDNVCMVLENADDECIIVSIVKLRMKFVV